MDSSTQVAESPSVDPAEAAHFRRLASMWWDPDGPFWPLHRLNTARVPWILEQLYELRGLDTTQSQPLKGLQLLDIGCGGGLLAEAMSRAGAEVHGIDVVEQNLRIAREHAAGEELDIRYDLVAAEDLAKTGTRYDIILNMEVVEHVADFEGFMAATCDLLRPRGQLFAATINRTPLAWLTAIFGAEYVLRWMPRNTHHWSKLRKPGELAAVLNDGGLNVRSSTGVRVNPFSRTLSLCESQAVNYMLCASRDYSLAAAGTG